MAKNITLTFENINQNGKPCKSPIILITGTTGQIAYPCGDKVDKKGNIKITVPDDIFTNECVTGVIQCSSCSSCPEVPFEICLCSDSKDCKNCQQCLNGICSDICPDKKCVDNKCVECETKDDCKPGFTCINGECHCYGFINAEGNCVECLSNANCSNCETCTSEGNCEPLECPNNLICIGNECGCPAGTKYDLATDSCVPEGCTQDTQCPECSICVNGNCEEIKCPEGYKCVGGECIYWPCVNTSCDNGADCGQNCGCLNGECVPCYLLECTGECAEALGCKCNANTEKCEPVDNCGQYCDGSTPCLDENCTCYNNTCVSCENFPCNPDDCSSRYNCGCNDGNCGGGNGCGDKIELKKEEDCNNPEGCALVANYTTKNTCGCDPIEVRVKNTKGCDLTDTRHTNVVLNLNIELFKNNIPYADYLNQLSIGDDELIEGTITTTIKHYVQNSLNAWVETAAAGAVPPPTLTVVGNTVDPLVITNAMIKDQINLSPTKVVVEVVASGFKIPENSCILYDTKVIATYELNFLNYANTCAKINGAYKTPISTLLTDNVSIRRPLFVWSKSTTGVFENTKYKNNGVYNQSGWFRKEYGVLVGGVWTDKITNPDQGLVNNYNYKVRVDCSCKVTDATLQKVIFCCPKEYEYVISNCGRKITIKNFDTCKPNRRIPFNDITEIQTYYYVVINGTDYLLREDGGNLITDYMLEIDEPISTIVFEQRYKGTPLVAKACEVSYEENPDLPDFNVSTECGKIIVTKIQGTPNITSVIAQDLTFVSTVNGTVWTAVTPKVNAIYKVTTKFGDVCVNTKDVQVSCGTDVVATPTDIVAKGECPNGVNPDITVSVVSGFTVAAEFQDPRNLQWYPADAGTNPVSKKFTNFAAGTYTFNVRETGKTDASDVVTIKPTIKPIVNVTNICGQTGGSISLSAGNPGSTWKVIGPQFVTSQPNIVLDSNGNAVVNITVAGTYTIQFVSDSTGFTCNQSFTATVTSSGGQVTPTIVSNFDTVCQGGEILFKITDGGQNLIYTVTGGGGNITDLNGNPINTLVSTNNAYNAKFIPTTQSGQITVTGVIGNCVTMGGPVQKVITVTAGPILIADNISVECSTDVFGTYNIYIPVSGSLDNVIVTVLPNGVQATFQGDQWVIQDIQFPSYPLLITAENTVTGCVSTVTYDETLPTCTPETLCPPQPQTVQIAASPASPTCGPQTVVLSFVTSSLGSLVGYTYQWREQLGSSSIVVEQGTVSTSVPNFSVTSTAQERNYFLRLITSNGLCSFDSVSEYVQAGDNLYPDIYTTSPGPITTTGTYTYQVNPVSGATYQWTISNASTGFVPQNVGSNQSSISIPADVAFVPGVNTLGITVTAGACTGTATETINVELNCPQIVTISPAVLPNGGSLNCKDLTATVTNNTQAITSHRWLIDGIQVQAGGATIVNLNTDIIAQGDTVDVTIEITFANGCVVTSAIYPYTKCACLCTTNEQCTNSIALSSVNGTQSHIVPNADIYIKFKIGGYPDRLIIKNSNNTITYLDTYQVGTNSNIGPFAIGAGYTTPYQSFDLNPANADTWQTGIAVGDNIANLRTATSDCAGLATLYANAPSGSVVQNDPSFYPIVLAGVIAIRGNDESGEKIALIKIPAAALADTTLNITGIPSQTEMTCPLLPPSTGHYSNSASYEISCESFDPLLP